MLLHGFNHHLADGDVLSERGVGPAVAPGVDLLELYGATGVDAGQETPAEVYGAEDTAFHAEDVHGFAVDPDASLDPGEDLGDDCRGLIARVGRAIEDNLRGVEVWALRLAGSVAEDCGAGKLADKFESVTARGGVAFVALDEVPG